MAWGPLEANTQGICMGRRPVEIKQLCMADDKQPIQNQWSFLPVRNGAIFTSDSFNNHWNNRKSDIAVVIGSKLMLLNR